MSLLDIENRVRTRLQNKILPRMKKDYPKLNFSTEEKDDKNYPFVYVHEGQGQSIGRELAGNTLNGVSNSIIIKVFSDNSKKDVQDVMIECVNEMTLMRYDLVGTPEYKNSGNLYDGSARFRRPICEGDTL